MIRIWDVIYPNSVRKNESFNIKTRIFYLVFPFTNIFFEIRGDGNLIERMGKRVIFFIGICNFNVVDTIEDNTTYEINVGYVK